MADPVANYYRQFNGFLDELFAATIEGRAPKLPHLCDDCGERAATETWDYSDAPIPNPPAPDHFCGPCADQRRKRADERAMEG